MKFAPQLDCRFGAQLGKCWSHWPTQKDFQGDGRVILNYILEWPLYPCCSQIIKIYKTKARKILFLLHPMS